MSERKLQLLIIGSGAAGLTAAIYAARAGYEPVVLTGMQNGGQLTITTEVENYPGFAEAVQGPWLMEQMEAQARAVGTEIIFDTVTNVNFSAGAKNVNGDSGTTYSCDAVIVATGASAKWLGLPSEEKFASKGVSACATCDGFFYRNRDVAVVGGGNTAVEEALYLSKIAKSVKLIHRRDELRAEKILQERLLATENITPIWNVTVDEILGDEMGVNGIRLKSTTDDSLQNINVHGVFIAIGHDPSTKFLKGAIDLDDEGYIICPPGSVRTNVNGVFAAGDCVDKVYRQAVTAAGMGCMAALDAEKYLAEMAI
ncbi:MAG: thioredoxin-disulfide reductase [Alphaproteobacteria bacterium]